MQQDTTEKEYLMLRDEIMKYYDIIHESRNILYVALAAILTFAVSSDEPLLCLVPYCVIIPIYIVTIDYQYGMWRMGTYLAVFLESKEFKWENRSHIFKENIDMNEHTSSYRLKMGKFYKRHLIFVSRIEQPVTPFIRFSGRI